MKKMKLKKDHPTAQKLNKIFRIMDNMGLSISVSDDEISVTDKQSDKVYRVEDVEPDNELCAEFPPVYDYKITYTKDDD